MKVYSLIDITETKSYRSNSKDTLMIDQQANFMTLIQTLTLGTNFFYDKPPTLQKFTENKLKKIGFGTAYKGSHNVWCLELRVDEGRTEPSLDILEADFDLVPVIPDLKETIQINNNVFRTSDKKAKNIIFEQAVEENIEHNQA